MEFDLYAGIDWSRAKTPRGGIQIAYYEKGDSCPEFVSPSGTGNWRWTRQAVFDWISSRVTKGERLVVRKDTIWTKKLGF